MSTAPLSQALHLNPLHFTTLQTKTLHINLVCSSLITTLRITSLIYTHPSPEFTCLFCDTVWFSLMLSKRRPLSLNFMFGIGKKSRRGEVRWVGRMGDGCLIRRSQKLFHNERRVSRSVVMMQDPGVFVALVWKSAPDVFPQSPQNLAI